MRRDDENEANGKARMISTLSGAVACCLLALGPTNKVLLGAEEESCLNTTILSRDSLSIASSLTRVRKLVYELSSESSRRRVLVTLRNETCVDAFVRTYRVGYSRLRTEDIDFVI